MKKGFFILLLLACFAAFAQKKTASPVMPDIAAMQKMTPAQLEAYKQQLIKQASQQAKAVSNQYNLKINEVALPDFQVQMPPKDFKRLALLPVQPPTLIQLADGLRQAKKDLQAALPATVVEEVQQITRVQTPAQQQSSSIAAFYGDKPAHALLISMNSALQNMNEVVGLNNLAAMFNMVKLEQKAVPILMNLLAKDPTNSMFLNNMGQAFLGLGELTVAEDFLTRCLMEDELHPEANHSMGMLKLFKKESEAAMKYFEKEMEVAYRGSTLALFKKNGGKINLYNLRKKRKDIPEKNFFEEINLSQFVIPSFPGKIEDSKKVKEETKDFAPSVHDEMMFWMNTASELTLGYKKEDGEKHHGIYHELVKVMLEDLEGLFPPENLSLFTDSDIETLQYMLSTYNTKMRALEEKFPPHPLGLVPGEIEAWNKIVCNMKAPVMNAYMLEYNSFVSNRIATIQPRWKHYVNGLVSIVSLDPSDANKIAVYRTVQAYFSFVGFAWGQGQFIEPPEECQVKSELTTEQAEAILKSSRDPNINCPPYLNLDIDLQLARMKFDCSKYGLEIGQGLMASYEKEFKTGKSTIAAGVGVKAKFLHLGKASAKQMLYLTFDDNNKLSDVGLKGTAGASIGLETEALMVSDIGKISATLAGVEGGYTAGISSGLNANVKGTGIFSDVKWQTNKN